MRSPNTKTQICIMYIHTQLHGYMATRRTFINLREWQEVGFCIGFRFINRRCFLGQLSYVVMFGCEVWYLMRQFLIAVICPDFIHSNMFLSEFIIGYKNVCSIKGSRVLLYVFVHNLRQLVKNNWCAMRIRFLTKYGVVWDMRGRFSMNRIAFVCRICKLFWFFCVVDLHNRWQYIKRESMRLKYSCFFKISGQDICKGKYLTNWTWYTCFKFVDMAGPFKVLLKMHTKKRYMRNPLDLFIFEDHGIRCERRFFSC